MSHPPYRVLLTLAAAVLVAACAGTGGARDPFDAGSERITIEVENLNFNDATLHAISSTGRRRLGVVSGKGSARFTIAWNFSQALQVEIDLLSAGSCVTRPLQVDPGEIVYLQIEVNLERDPDCR